MKLIKQLIAIACVAFATSAAANPAEAPDALVKRISAEVIETAKSDKDIRPVTRRKSWTWSRPRSCLTSISSA